jgi:DNA-binding phage protein
MYELTELITLLKTMNLTKVAEQSGVQYGRLYRMVHGNSGPSYDTVRRITTYIESLKLTKAA